MAEPAFFLGYRPVPFKSSEFAPGDKRKEECHEFMVSDLARSGLTPEDIHASIHPFFIEGVDAAYLIPYTDLDGRFINSEDGYSRMHRIRLKLNAQGRGKRGKYSGPSSDDVGMEMCIAPYIPPGGLRGGGEVLYICEGEKKTLALMKHMEQDCLGIGGKDNWGRGGMLHPWLESVAGAYEKVVIVPDGDIHRYDIAKSYGTLASKLEDLGCEVVTLDIESKIDDMIVDGLTVEAFLDLNVLVDRIESGDYLVNEYGLTYDTVRKAKRIVANESNAFILMNKHPVFPRVWRNLDTDQVHFGDHEDTDEHVLLNLFQHNLGMTNMKMNTVLHSIEHIARRRGKSPWLEWLKGLEWDGVERLGGLFSSYCGSEDTSFNRELGMKWLTASVARQFEPGAQCDYVIIAQGGQGIGKSTFVHCLFRDEAVDIIGAEAQNKDELAKMHMGKCVVFEEMASMGHKDLEHLKALVTSREDFYRPPYARNTERRKRRFVMYASTNRANFLNNDPSGYRRWAVVHMEKIDIDLVERDRDQLWAEAVTLWREDFTYGWVDVPESVIGGFVKAVPIVEMFEEALVGGVFKASEHTWDSANQTYHLTMKDLMTGMGLDYVGGRSGLEQRDLREHLSNTKWLFRDNTMCGGKRKRSVFKKKIV